MTRLGLPKRAALLAALVGVAGCASLPSAEGDSGTEAATDNLTVGREVFTSLSQPRCGACHALADAGADGTLGPNLDALKPDAPSVIAAVTGGVGIMQAQEHLSEEQVRALASYVSRVAGQPE